MHKKESQQSPEVRYYSFECKSNDDGVIEGYGSVFSEVDSYDDTIAKGAFLTTLEAHKESKTMPAMLWQHDSEKPIGVWTKMYEDSKGLYVKGQLALDTMQGKEAHALLKMGALNGLSIGFRSVRWEYDEKTDIRTLNEIDLWEVSVVTFPANKKSKLTSVKSTDLSEIKTIRQAELALRDAGLPVESSKALVAQIKRIALSERDAHLVKYALQAANKLLNTLKN